MPLTFDELRLRLAASDWLGKFDLPDATAAERDAHLRQIWHEQYGPLVAEPFAELVALAGRHAVSVYVRATLDDLAAATAAHRVVILFGHWKGPDIVNDDLTPALDLTALRAALARAGAGDPVLRAAGRMLEGSKLSRALAQFGVARKCVTVRDVLVGVVDAPELEEEPTDGADVVLESFEVARARRRERLDALLPGLLRPGNRRELFDGLHGREAVEAAIAASFTGVLDLTCCTSTYLADFIGARRRNALRTVQFPQPQKFDWAVRCAQLALQLLLDGQGDYLAARKRANDQLTQLVLETHARLRSPDL